ncbi:MAG TPA: sigma-70 family RNA polymerase sigma factor [Ilumatobacter sp.]|nr:sigma-70 family RNA polymerase sigma factor [Ilumatobacter sp.]
MSNDDRPDAADRFNVLMKAVEFRVRRALVARYGIEIGDDAAAEAFAWAWENLDEVEGMSNPAGYLFRVGQSAAKRLMGWRRQHRKLYEPPADSDLRARMDNDLLSSLRRLSTDQRAAVLLVHGYGFSYAEVADTLGVSEAAVTNHVHRGLKRLRRLLGDVDANG